MQPTAPTSDMNMAAERIGAERLRGAYAWRTFLDQGTRIAAGSDFPVESPNPFLGMHAAVTRRDAEGRPPGGWHAEQAVTIGEIFGRTRWMPPMPRTWRRRSARWSPASGPTSFSSTAICSQWRRRTSGGSRSSRPGSRGKGFLKTAHRHPARPPRLRDRGSRGKLGLDAEGGEFPRVPASVSVSSSMSRPSSYSESFSPSRRSSVSGLRVFSYASSAIGDPRPCRVAAAHLPWIYQCP